MKCVHCGSQQDDGKFCGQCGGELISANESQPASPGLGAVTHSEVKQASVTVNHHSHGNSDSFDKLKDTSRAYGGFFKSYVRQPSQIFLSRSRESTNGFISIGLTLLLIALTFNTILSNLLTYYHYKPSFVSVLIYVSIYLLVLVAAVISSLFLINKFFGTDCAYKDMISIFGIHMTPVAVVSAAAFILSIIKSNDFALLLLVISILLMFYLIPLYIISSLLTRRPKGLDPLYGYLIYIVVVGIVFIVVNSVMLDSAIGQMLEEFMW